MALCAQSTPATAQACTPGCADRQASTLKWLQSQYSQLYFCDGMPGCDSAPAAAWHISNRRAELLLLCD
jgi:hypothetical protein